MNIIVNGILGQMGAEVLRLSASGYRSARVVLGIDPSAENTTYSTPLCKSWREVLDIHSARCIIDFSNHSCVPELLEFAVGFELPTVICTTGHTEAELSLIRDAAKKIPIFHSANMSLGVALLVELAKTAALAMPDAEIEIIEKHHSKKVDAPSGTALMLATAIASVRHGTYFNLGRRGYGKRAPEEIGIHALRMGNSVGMHEVIIGTPNQTISLKHEAHNRSMFAEGAILAAEFLIGKERGLYDMRSLVSGEGLE